MSLKLFFILFLSLWCHTFVASISQYPIVIIISYDGFRHDLIEKGVTPTISKLRSEGTHAEYMNNVFITKTFPNHHSIATGLYPEVHGVLGNSVYDPKYGKSFSYSYELFHYTEDILPIWVANQKKGNGRHSGIMMWPGNEFNYTGVFPTYQKAFDRDFAYTKRVDEVLKWILNPEKPANLVVLYIEEPDVSEHNYGPDSETNLKILKQMDDTTTYLMKRLNETGLTDRVNLFFLSDHGMLTVKKRNIIDLRKIVPTEKYDRYEGSPTYMIFPKKGEANFVYNSLKNASENGAPFKVYKRNEIPDRWHYKDNRRAPPILAVADPPYVFEDAYKQIEWIEKLRNITFGEDTPMGFHGYDNTVMSMKPYFFALGPLIKKNHKIKPFETVDLFSLWANILGFPEYAAKTNGSFDRVSDMLVPKYSPSDAGSKSPEFAFNDDNEL
ncbi:UNVERIFIED_CONTAM: hypothetical protein PYX00_001062 [Menopon gallinae]|uniref:Uncharacterized protein n=2 Tax=Menopon gallinae TaxID=328185 RepID=A0AAW2IBC3_9NEOP